MKWFNPDKMTITRFAVVYGVATIVVILLIAPQILSSSYMNAARLSQIKGKSALDFLSQAVAWQPEDQLLLWRVVWSLADELALPNTQAASTVALSTNLLSSRFVSNQRFDETAILFSVESLLRLGKTKHAFAVLDEMSLPDGKASRFIAVDLIRSSMLLTASLSTQYLLELTVKALNLTNQPQKITLIKQVIGSPNLWRTTSGQQLARTLDWIALGIRPDWANDNQPNLDQSPLVLQQATAENTAGRVSSMLSVKAHVGKNLVRFDDFETIRDGEVSLLQPQGWWANEMSNKPPFSPGLFVIGNDSSLPYEGRFSARIDGIIVQDGTPALETARAGYTYDSDNSIIIPSNSLIAVEFAYRTECLSSGEASLLIGYQGATLSGYAGSSVPPTYGQWRRITILFLNDSQERLLLVPNLLLWSNGSFWFDDFSIRQVFADRRNESIGALLFASSDTKFRFVQSMCFQADASTSVPC